MKQASPLPPIFRNFSIQNSLFHHQPIESNLLLIDSIQKAAENFRSFHIIPNPTDTPNSHYKVRSALLGMTKH